MNRNLATVVVCPITQSKKYPTRIEFDLEGEKNWIIVDQIRITDKSSILKTLESINSTTISLVKAVIRETFVD